MDCMALSKWIRWLYFHGLGGSATMEYSGRATRMVLEEDVNHRLKPHEVAKQVIAILNEEPVKPKRKATRRTPASKNICDYITDDN